MHRPSRRISWATLEKGLFVGPCHVLMVLFVKLSNPVCFPLLRHGERESRSFKVVTHRDNRSEYWSLKSSMLKHRIARSRSCVQRSSSNQPALCIAFERMNVLDPCQPGFVAKKSLMVTLVGTRSSMTSPSRTVRIPLMTASAPLATERQVCRWSGVHSSSSSRIDPSAWMMLLDVLKSLIPRARCTPVPVG